MRVFISAAESSSDVHGAQLLAALKSLSPDIEAIGIGGPKLQREGLMAVVDARELMAMGFVEVLGKIRKVFRSMDRAVAEVKKNPVDVAVFIDYPDFHFRLATRFRKMGVPLVYYIPPKVWVWRKNRLRFLKENFTKILCIFPFEPLFYSKNNVSAKYVGNPLLDELPLGLSQEEACAQLGLPPGSMSWILMPGSRQSEIRQHFELMLDAALEAATELDLNQSITILLPFPETSDLSEVQTLAENWKKSRSHRLNRTGAPFLDLRLSRGNAAICLAAAKGGLIKSGTSTLEAALMGCPHAVVYKPSRSTAWIFKNLIRYKGPVGLVNLAAGTNEATQNSGGEGSTERKQSFRFLAPEILCEEVTLERLKSELIRFIRDSDYTQNMKTDFMALREKMQSPESPSLLAAKEILSVKRIKGGLADERREGHFGLQSIGIWLLSAIWSSLNLVVRFLTKMGWIRAEKLPVRVISVGNIEAGGTGKTPLVAKIANEAHEKGLKVCILTRGYRGRWERVGGILFPGEPPELSDPTQCGDEAALLHELCPHAIIGVGRNRLKQFKKILESPGILLDLVILDDGFQNFRIKKDLEILTLTSDGWGNKFYRDFKYNLKKADLLVWTKGDYAPKGWESSFAQEKTIRSQYRLSRSEERSLGVEYWLICGVADSNSVFRSAQAAGFRVAKTEPLSDHYTYRLGEVRFWLDQAKGSGLKILLTGKDWVKWRKLGVNREDVEILEPEVSFLSGEDSWRKTLWGG